MTLKEMLAKVAKGEQLSDEERKFLSEYDEQKQLDAAAAAARKKADADAKAAKEALAKLQGEFDDFKAKNDPARSQDATAKLMQRIERLEAAKKAAEDKSAAMERTARVRELAKGAGIVAAKGVDAATIDLLVDHLMEKVDVDDADAVKAAFDSFKAANAGMIAANTVGGAGTKGTPGAGAFKGANPFAKETFNLTRQIEIRNEDPGLAESLQQAAAGEGK